MVGDMVRPTTTKASQTHKGIPHTNFVVQALVNTAKCVHSLLVSRIE